MVRLFHIFLTECCTFHSADRQKLVHEVPVVKPQQFGSHKVLMLRCKNKVVILKYLLKKCSNVHVPKIIYMEKIRI